MRRKLERLIPRRRTRLSASATLSLVKSIATHASGTARTTPAATPPIRWYPLGTGGTAVRVAVLAGDGAVRPRAGPAPHAVSDAVSASAVSAAAGIPIVTARGAGGPPA